MKASSDALFVQLMADIGPHLPGSVLADLYAEKQVVPWPDISTKQMACLQIAGSLLKKFQDRVAADADAKAIAKFTACNRKCGEWVLTCETTRDEVLIGEFKRAVYDFYYEEGLPLISSLGELFDHARPGPGASVGSRGNDFYTKLFDSPLTATSGLLYEAYVRSISKGSSYAQAEETRRERYGTFVATTVAKLQCVPKSVDVSRTICVEPSLNTFFQLGLGRIVEQRLRRSFGIDLAIQPDKNRELARRGSISGQYVTIDLSSASDSVSLKMVSQLFPPGFVAWLRALRTPSVRLPDGSVLQLEMLSSMGNGYTFPVETLIFSCIVSAAARFRGLTLLHPRRNSVGSWAVFGDDIICDVKIADDVLRLLELLGFTPNADKSFLIGPFRESCGSDYFQGHNVRGVYCKSLKRSLYPLINQLNLFSMRTGVSLPRTVSYLRSLVKWRPVPYAEADDAGIRVPFFMLDSRKLAKGLHGSIIYQRALKRPSVMRFSDGYVISPKGSKKRNYSPEGALQAFLRGDLADGKISIRNDENRYTVSRAVTPCWDHVPAVGPQSIGQADWQRWKAAVYTNLTG